jgi:hypothetical protein
MKRGSTSPPSIPVAVPVYRSEGAPLALVERLQPVLAALAREYEVILVK